MSEHSGRETGSLAPVTAVALFPLPGSGKINGVSRRVIYASGGHGIASKSFDLSSRERG